MLKRLWAGLICLIFTFTSHTALALNGESTASPEDFLSFSLQELTETRVTVASMSEETLEQTPVPISLISQTMIEQSGALTLKELLLTYVPGFTDVEDQNEINIAARGIFTSAQQKILILINGHRINSRSYSMAAPDHSISLNKVKQIEVLRGPASSLYGNVSLTATVNIILKSAKDVKQNNVTLLAGDHGQQGISTLLQGELLNSQLMFWAHHYQSDGESKTFARDDIYSADASAYNQAIIGGFKDKSPFDIGFTLAGTYGELLVNSRRSHYIEPFSAGGLSGEPYPYDKFQTSNGWGAGIGYTTHHIDFKKQSTLGAWRNETRLYWDHYSTESSVIINPAAPTYGAPKWKDSSIGLLSTFESSKWHGNWLFGTQIEGYKVYGAGMPIGINSYRFNAENNNMLPNGIESNYSVFAQHKAKINSHWQSNLGVRYDYKNRNVTDNVDQLSPRLALIYTNDNTNIKFSYSQSFVDATYWNRFSNLSSFKGAANLKPEKLRSVQISPSMTITQYNLQLVSNFFYDQAIDVIYRDNYASENNYSNAGKLKTWGLEQEINYLTPNLNVRLNATFRQAVSSEKIAIKDSYINNVPKLTANLIVDKALNEDISAHFAIRYIGKQFSPIVIQQDGKVVIDPYPDSGVDFVKPHHFERETWLVNANLRFQTSKNLLFNIRAENVLDKSYRQGGTTLHPYPKKGRWFSIQAKYSF